MASVEAEIAAWRSYVAGAPGMNGRDVDELEVHLRDQIAELGAAGLAPDEAFLIAVKRLGDIDDLSLEFAREHSGRMWKQMAEREEPAAASGWLQAFAFAAGAAVVVQVARLAAGSPEREADWLYRSFALLVFPFLAGYLARRRGLDVRGWLVSGAPFLFLGIVVNLYPYEPGSATQTLVAAHLPVLAWCLLVYPYAGGAPGSHERRMDFVRFTGEWAIYYTLIALGGGVLTGLTVAILDPIRPGLGEQAVEWLLPSGAAGAVVVAAWLVESKQRVVENMAPVLTMLFTPLFAAVLTVAVAGYALTGGGEGFDRALLGTFDALMVVVLGLVLYSQSARDPARPAGAMDRIELLTVVAALALDVMVLGSMVIRIGDLGFTPNRVAALGLNLVLLVNLAGAGWLSARFVARKVAFHHLERWQTAYLPVFAVWTAIVVLALPPIFGFA